MRRKKDAKVEGKGGMSDGRSRNIVPAIIITVGLVLGGKFMGGGKPATATSAPAETTTTTIEPGPVKKLDPITLNMSDGRFLRVGVAFQLVALEEEEAASGEEGKAEPDPRDEVGEYAKALDIVIAELGRSSYGELIRTDSRKVVKDAIVAKLREEYPEHIEDLYFTEFVLQ